MDSTRQTQKRPTAYSLRSKVLLPAILLVAGSSLYAQQAGSIRGTVFDKEFNAPLAGAQVTIVETGEKITATDEGHYLFNQVQPGNYTLIYSKEGYARQVNANVVVSSGEMTDAEASLSGEFTEMEEFVVQDLQMGGGTEAGLLNLRMESPALMDSVSSDLMSRAGAGDAASALRLVAGASVQDGKYAVVRGLPDRYVSSQMNGVRLPTADASKRAVQLDQFPSSLLESIQVSKTFTPDQQGDASGGAVNVVLKKVPDEPVLSFKAGGGWNSQATGNDKFLTYNGGGVSYWGKDDGGRDLPLGVSDAFRNTEVRLTRAPNATELDRYAERDRQVSLFSPVMGSKTSTAPFDHNWSVTAGNSKDLGPVRVGAFGAFNYKQEFSHYEDGTNDKRTGQPAQNRFGYHAGTEGTDRYELYDVTKSAQSVLWGGLLALGAKTEDHQVGLTFMQTQSAEDSVMVMDDKRGNSSAVPSPAGVYYRNESLRYTERLTSTLQFSGKHTLPFPEARAGRFFELLNPEIDWAASRNKATMWEPDQRGLVAQWRPDDPADMNGSGTWRRVNVAGDYAGLRLWRDIAEEGDQYQVNAKIPFEQWTQTKGYLKAGVFNDEIERTYRQDSFTYKHGPGNTPWAETSGTFYGSSFARLFGIREALGYDGTDYDAHLPPFLRSRNEMPWQILKTGDDADYDGEQTISAWYWMADVPVTSWLKGVGGVRTEKTEMSTTFRASDGETLSFFRWESGNLVADRVNSNRWSEADAKINRTDVLPSMGFEFDPLKKLKFRGVYSQTIARPTFKEISPVVQADYLGSDQFAGNNNLDLVELKNYDLRVEYIPVDGSFLSASWFHKDLKGPIEYVSVAIAQTRYIQPFNFPEGWIRGYELEARQDVGVLHEWFEGLDIRFSATVMDSEVTVPEMLPDTNRQFAGRGIGGKPGQVIASKRDMRGTPEYLLNVGITYDIAMTGTQLSLFYIHKGDTLIAGEGYTDHYVPNLYEKETGELNAGLTQKIGKNVKLSIGLKNILNPKIKTVYRSPYISGEAEKSSYTKGIGASVSLSCEF